MPTLTMQEKLDTLLSETKAGLRSERNRLDAALEEGRLGDAIQCQQDIDGFEVDIQRLEKMIDRCYVLSRARRRR